MPRTEEENQRIREVQREKILEAAKLVFARKGWAATIADIATEANVSQGLAYRYFTNKEAIFIELMGQILKSSSLRFEKMRETEGSPTERMEKIISRMLESRRESIAAFGMAVQATRDDMPSSNYIQYMHGMLHSQPADDPDSKNIREMMLERLRESNADSESFTIRKMMLRRFQMLRDLMTQVIKDGQATGEFAQDDPAKLALMVITSIQSLTSLAMHHPDEYLRHYPYSKIIMRMLKPDGTTPETKAE